MRVSASFLLLVVSAALLCVSFSTALPRHKSLQAHIARSALEAVTTPHVAAAAAPAAAPPAAASLTAVLSLTPAQLLDIATKKATCPFIGSAVASGALPVRGSAQFPLASIADVQRLGNIGGGNLGDVLKIFATGNQNKMRKSLTESTLSHQVPDGFFSLDFPGSQGSHWGHSGILESSPVVVDSGRFSQADFDRLLSFSSNGFITRSSVGAFIAQNLKRDPRSKVGASSVLPIVEDSIKAFTTLFTKGNEIQTLTKVAGDNNLVGSSGEFGLLFAFLAPGKDSKTINGEIAISVADVTDMFKNKKFPADWHFTQKKATDWVAHSTALSVAAIKAYHKL